MLSNHILCFNLLSIFVRLTKYAVCDMQYDTLNQILKKKSMHRPRPIFIDRISGISEKFTGPNYRVVLSDYVSVHGAV